MLTRKVQKELKPRD